MELDCTICSGPIVDRAKPAECTHANFCFECLAQWFLVSNTCPLCKCNVKEVVHRPCKHCDFVRASDELELDEDDTAAPEISFAERRASARIRNKNLVCKPKAPLGTGKIVSIGVHKVKKQKQKNPFDDDDPFWEGSSEEEEEEATQCEVCHSDERDDVLLLCDMCDEAYHIYCLPVPLPAVPDHEWLCGKCDPHNVMNSTFEGATEQRGRRRRGRGRAGTSTTTANVTRSSPSIASATTSSPPSSSSCTSSSSSSCSSSETSCSPDTSSSAFPPSWPSAFSSSSWDSPDSSFSPSSSRIKTEPKTESQRSIKREIGITKKESPESAPRNRRQRSSRPAQRRTSTATSRDIAAAAVAAITGRRAPLLSPPKPKEEESSSLAGLPSHLQAAMREDQRIASVVRVFPGRDYAPRAAPYYNLSGLSDAPVETGPAADQWMNSLLMASSKPETLPVDVEAERGYKREQVRAAIREANLARRFDRLRRNMRKKRDEEEAKIELLDKDMSFDKAKMVIQTSTPASEALSLAAEQKAAVGPKPITPFEEAIQVETVPDKLFDDKKPPEAKSAEKKKHLHKPTSDDRPIIQMHVKKILSKRYPAYRDPRPVQEYVLNKVWGEWSAKPRPVSIGSWLNTEKIRKWVSDSITKEIKKRSKKS